MLRIIIKTGILLLIECMHLNGEWSKAKYADAFLMNPLGSRAAAMGGAFTAVASDVSAIYWNPAGLVHISCAQLTGMHSERFAGMVNMDFIAGSIPVQEKAAMGIGYFRLGTDNIPKTRLENMNQPLSPENRPYVEKYLQDQESALFFSYSKILSSNLYWGTSIKVISRSMGDYYSWGLGFDGGILYFPTEALRLGASLKNATGTILAWRHGKKEYILPQLNIGIAYSIIYKQYDILPTVDLLNLFYQDSDACFQLGNWSSYMHAGLEIKYMKRLHLRIGSFRGQLTAGAGFQIAFTQVDYCYSRHTDLGDSHLISLTLQKSRTDQP